MVLVAFPVEFEVACVLMFKPLIGCMSSPASRNATAFVFDLNAIGASTPPVLTISLPHHFAMHHVNAYDEQNGDLVFEEAAYDENIFQANNQHADLDVMRDPSRRDNVPKWAKLRTFRIIMSKSVGKSLGPTTASVVSEDAVLIDDLGRDYRIDFPFVNPAVAQRRHRFV